MYTFLFEHLLSNIWGLCLGEEMLDHMITLCLTYSRTSKLFSTLTLSYKAPGILACALATWETVTEFKKYVGELGDLGVGQTVTA